MRIFGYLILNIVIFTVLTGRLLSAWEDVSPKNTKEDLYGVSFSSRDTGYVAGWGSVGSVILKTTNGGSSWIRSAIAGTMTFNIHAVDGQNVYAVGYDFAQMCGLVMHSTDGGLNWTNTYFTEEDKRFTFGLYGLAVTGEGTLLVCGYNGKIFKTTDGGQTWAAAVTNTNDQIFSGLQFPDKDCGYAISGSTENIMNRLYRTTDGGGSWELVSDFQYSLSIGSVYFINKNQGYLFGSKDGAEAILRTDDGGQNWQKVYCGQSGQELENGSMIDSKFGFAIGEDGYIARSEDGGGSWTNEFSGITAVFNSVAGLNCDGEVVAYAAGSRGSVVKYTRLLGTGGDAADAGTSAMSRDYMGKVIEFETPVTGASELAIYNAAGESVLARKLNGSGGESVSLEAMAPGIYYYYIYSGGRMWRWGRILN